MLADSFEANHVAQTMKTVILFLTQGGFSIQNTVFLM